MPTALRLRPLIAETTFNVFKPRSVILWSHKKINEKREQNSWLGQATSAILPAPVRAGWYQHYEKGSIYYSDAGACVIYGLIRDKWASMGWAQTMVLGASIISKEDRFIGPPRLVHTKYMVIFGKNGLTWVPSKQD
jgi:hypothetical protein